MEEALTALLATVAGGRRYWGRKPQDESSSHYVILRRISGQRDYHMQGSSRYVQSRVQIDVYGETYTTVRNTVKEIVAILSGYRGGIIQGIFLDSQRDLPATDAGEVTYLFRTSVDAIIHHTE